MLFDILFDIDEAADICASLNIHDVDSANDDNDDGMVNVVVGGLGFCPFPALFFSSPFIRTIKPGEYSNRSNCCMECFGFNSQLGIFVASTFSPEILSMRRYCRYMY